MKREKKKVVEKCFVNVGVYIVGAKEYAYVICWISTEMKKESAERCGKVKATEITFISITNADTYS